LLISLLSLIDDKITSSSIIDRQKIANKNEQKKLAISLVKGKENVKMYQFYSNWLNLSSSTNPTNSSAPDNKHQNFIGLKFDTSAHAIAKMWLT